MSTIIIADPPTSYPYPSRDRSNPIGPTIRRCPNLPYGQGLRNWKKKKSLESPFDLSETIPHNRWKPLVFSLSLSYISNLLNLTLSSTSRLIRRWKAGKVTLFHSVPLSFIPLPSYLTIQTISVSKRSLPLPLFILSHCSTREIKRVSDDTRFRGIECARGRCLRRYNGGLFCYFIGDSGSNAASGVGQE